MDKSVIPAGSYCYDEKGVCPYWKIVEGLPEQENGHCSYLNQNDYERNETTGQVKWESQRGSVYTDPHEIPISLLWDKCKECNVNDEILEEDLV